MLLLAFAACGKFPVPAPRLGVQAQGSPRGNPSEVNPAASARLTQVKVVYTGGLCGPGYCTNITSVEPSLIIQESKASDPKRFPDITRRIAITRREWEELERALDMNALNSAPQTICQAVVDLPCSWLEVQLSDGTKTVVGYDPSKPPSPVAPLLRQLSAIQHSSALVNKSKHVPEYDGDVTSGPLPNAATARARAELVLARRNWLFPPLTATLKDGIWTVVGTLRCQEVLPRQKKACYGGAGVRIRESDGRILQVFPPTHD